MKKSEIIFSKYSPLMAVDTPLTGADGESIETPRVYSLCRCGESNYKPLCDGSHAQAEFVGEREDSNKKETEHYKGKEITIVFDSYLCMGAGFCVDLESEKFQRLFKKVFLGKEDPPRYDPDSASVEEIIKIIKKCPSGALSYILKGERKTNYCENTRIVVETDGQLNCQGEIELKDDQHSDRLLPKADHYTLCRCGGSKKKPLCDGSHKDNGFKG
jgi:CDGSH-type Zn-finger protein